MAWANPIQPRLDRYDYIITFQRDNTTSTTLQQNLA